MFSLRCLIYKVHATRRKLSYDIMSFSSCQALFSSFFKLFRAVIRKESQLVSPGSVELGRRSRKQLVHIITRSFLCQALFSDSSNLFQAARLRSELVCRFFAARLSYQIPHHLSIGKSKQIPPSFSFGF